MSAATLRFQPCLELHKATRCIDGFLGGFTKVPQARVRTWPEDNLAVPHQHWERGERWRACSCSRPLSSSPASPVYDTGPSSHPESGCCRGHGQRCRQCSSGCGSSGSHDPHKTRQHAVGRRCSISRRLSVNVCISSSCHKSCSHILYQLVPAVNCA